MFNKNFYPTPPELIDKMLTGVDFTEIDSVLEPSAGKGNLVDGYIEKMKNRTYYKYGYGYNYKKDIDCIEIDNELQATLKGQGYRVVHNNFLSFQTHKKYDLILMNPPFDNGDLHLLKALKMQEDGGSIICLLNAETLKNPYSNTRKELVQKLNSYNANIEYIENAFIHAERKTNVEIALIKVFIQKKEFECNFLNELRQQEVYEEIYDTSCTELTKFVGENQYIESAVEQYNTEIKLGIKLIREYNSMLPYIKNKIERENSTNYGVAPILSLKVNDDDSLSNYATINNYVKKVRYKYWETLFNNPKFTEKLTSNLVSELWKKLKDLQEYDFSVWNIMTIQEEMLKNTIKGVEQTILDLFDEFSNKYHYYDETSKNIHYYNGWKTNKSYKINKKIILPHNAFSWYDNSPQLDRHHTSSKFKDIIKVFNYLATENYLDINVENILTESQKTYNTKNIDMGYFKVTFYKKGTCHIEFLDLELLKKFNLFGSQKKGWLPPNYGKKQYKDMTTEEKEVVKEFSGNEEEYNKILQNQKYYLVDASSILLLENN